MPVDEWAQANRSLSGERTVDVKALAILAWDKRKFILKVVGCFVLIGILIILLSPVGYKVEATLLPENQEVPVSGLLQQFGGILGLGNAMQSQNENLPPQLYPKVAYSLPFQVALLNKQVTFIRYDSTTTLYTFFDEVYTPSFLSYIQSYTLGLPAKIMGLFNEGSPPVPLPETVERDSIISLTKHQLLIINQMRKHLSLDVNDDNGLVTLSVFMPDARAAAETGQFAIDLLKQFVTDYRTEKATRYLEFVEQQTELAGREFQDIATRLAEFKDRNINIATAKAEMELKNLEAKYDLFFSKYSSLEQQLQQAKLEVQKKTPVLTVLQPIKVPVDNYTPQKKLILLVMFCAGLILSVFYVIARSILKERNVPV